MSAPTPAQLRQALLGRLNEHSVAQIIAKLVCKAKAGDIVAAREVLDRSIGKPAQSVQIAATVHAREQDRTPDRWEYLQQMIERYARVSVPKRAWIAGIRRQYEAWKQGNTNGHRPANWEQIVEEVEARCNWIRMTPAAAKDWRTDAMIYDDHELKHANRTLARVPREAPTPRMPKIDPSR